MREGVREGGSEFGGGVVVCIGWLTGSGVGGVT